MNFTDFDVVYFDLDGVLADWVLAFEEYFSTTIETFNTYDKEERAEFKKRLGYDFFYNLKEIPVGIELFNLVVDLVGPDRVAILSAYGDFNTDEVIAAKRDWVREHLGDFAVHLVPKLEDKTVFANENVLLIDDRERAVDAFRSAGGNAILFV